MIGIKIIKINFLTEYFAWDLIIHIGFKMNLVKTLHYIHQYYYILKQVKSSKQPNRNGLIIGNIKGLKVEKSN